MKRTKKMKLTKLLQRNLAFFLAMVLMALVVIPGGTVQATGESPTNKTISDETSDSEYGDAETSTQIDTYELGNSMLTTTKAGIKINLFDYGSSISNDLNDGSSAPLKFNGGVLGESRQYLDISQQGKSGLWSNMSSKRYLVNGAPVLTSDEFPNGSDLGYLFDESLEVIRDENTGVPLKPYDDSFLNPSGETNYKVHRYDVKTGSLFMESDDGYLYYDSKNNHAYYDYEKESIVVMDYAVKPGFNVDSRYLEMGHFLPFNGPLSDYTAGTDYVKVAEKGTIISDDEEDHASVNDYYPHPDSSKEEYQGPSPKAGLSKTTNDLYRLNTSSNITTDKSKQINMWFGMKTEFDFYQPESGKIDGKDMIYEFSGDDFMWVYIDDVLILDIFHHQAGCNSGAIAASINFTTGEVFVYKNDYSYADIEGLKTKEEREPYLSVDTTLAECYEEALKEAKKDGKSITVPEFTDDGTTFADHTRHNFKMFYQEYGTNTSNCYLRFNMVPVPTGNVSLEKQVEAFDDSHLKRDDEFTYQMTAEHSSETIENINYQIFDINTTQITDGSLKSGETFKLKDNQRIIFDLPDDTRVTFKEILPEDTKYNVSWTLNGNACSTQNDAVSGTVDATNATDFVCTNTLCQVVTNKTVSTPEPNGKYTLTLDAFATGSSTQVASDIVIAVDQSGSMYRPLNVENNLYNAEKGLEESLKNLDKENSLKTGYYIAQYEAAEGAAKQEDHTYHYIVKYDEISEKWKLYKTGTDAIYCTEWNHAVDMTQFESYNPNPEELNLKLNDGRTLKGIYLTRYGAAYDSLNDFINSLAATGVDHRIAMLGYSRGVNPPTVSYVNSNNENNGTVLFNGSSSKVVNELKDSDYKNAFKAASTQKEDLKASVDALSTCWALTCQEVAFRMANQIFEQNPIADGEARNRIILLLTDGIATIHADAIYNENGNITYEDGTNMPSETHVALALDGSIKEANISKEKYGADVYCVGTLSKTDADSYNAAFLDYSSSNYVGIDKMPAEGEVYPAISDEYNHNVENENALTGLLASINQNLSGTSINLNSTAVLQDTISTNFKLPEGVKVSDIKVYTADYLGNKTFSEELTELKDVTVTLDTSKNVVRVTGFDYSANYVAEATSTDAARGKKLIVKIPIIRSESNDGGYHQKTNDDPNTGIYVDGDKEYDFPLPYADEPTSITIKKKVIGTNDDKKDKFSFNISYKSSNYSSSYETINDDTKDASNYAKITKTVNENKDFALTGEANTNSITYNDVYVGKNASEANDVVITENASSDYQLESVTLNGKSIPVANGSVTIPIYEDNNLDIEIEFTNRKLNDVKITKNVTGNMGDTSMKFDFDVTLFDENNDALNYSVPESSIYVTENNNASFLLADDESVVLEKIPYGAQIKVNETNASEYETSVNVANTEYVLNDAISINQENMEVIVTNYKYVDIDTGIDDFIDSNRILFSCLVAIMALMGEVTLVRFYRRKRIR